MKFNELLKILLQISMICITVLFLGNTNITYLESPEDIVDNNMEQKTEYDWKDVFVIVFKICTITYAAVKLVQLGLGIGK